MSVSEQEFLPTLENSFPPPKTTTAGSGVAREGDHTIGRCGETATALSRIQFEVFEAPHLVVPGRLLALPGRGKSRYVNQK